MGLATGTGANATSAGCTITANASVTSWKITAIGHATTSGAGNAFHYLTIPSVRKDGAGGLTTFTMPIAPAGTAAGGQQIFAPGTEPLVDASQNCVITSNWGGSGSTFTAWVMYSAVPKG